ncbi:MAG: mismatch endonuclease Vsr [Candidatus Taylorbacteria bacterium]|nr:mismatch endonuclease Vsr [Candidatus Taylorbacteria bacterium]
MSKIRSESGVERKFRKLLSASVYPKGFRYRLHYKKVPGSPDVAFVAQKLAVFIDGTFWHGYGFSRRKHKLPKVFWLDKIKSNINRDRRNRKKLKRMGWGYVRVWEHDIKKDPKRCIEMITEKLKDAKSSVKRKH